VKRLWVRVSFIISAFVLTILIAIGMASFYFGDVRPIKTRDHDRMSMPFIGDKMVMTRRYQAPAHMVAIFAAIALAGLGTGVWIGRGISRPIADLADAAKRLGSGDLSYRVATKTRSQELTELTHAFNKMAEELERAEKLRNTLMADISHELRGPLTVLEGNLRAALDDVVKLDEGELANLYGQTRHLIRLVNDLRELALAEAGHLPLTYSKVDVNTLIEEVIWNYALIAEEKGLSISHDLAGDLTTIEVDEVRLRQILSNLISNAIRHTPEDGRVNVQSRHTAKDFILSVTDTGEGITSEHLPYLFDRFYRTDKSRQRETGGSGLGLAVVKALAESMGGHVTGSSEGINQGATFSVVLPKEQTHASQS
jgi:signal transduction histidine kinase